MWRRGGLRGARSYRTGRNRGRPNPSLPPTRLQGPPSSSPAIASASISQSPSAPTAPIFNINRNNVVSQRISAPPSTLLPNANAEISASAPVIVSSTNVAPEPDVSPPDNDASHTALNQNNTRQRNSPSIDDAHIPVNSPEAEPEVIRTPQSNVSPPTEQADRGTNRPNVCTRAIRLHAPRDASLPRDSNGRYRISLDEYGRFQNSQQVSKYVTKSFTSHPYLSGWTFSKLLESVIQLYWEEFKKLCYWNGELHSDDAVWGAYVEKLKERYKDVLSEYRVKRKRKPNWCTQEIWDYWSVMLKSPEFIKRSKQAIDNRKGGGEKAPATHTGGSIPHQVTRQRLAAVINRDPTPHELFIYTHTREHDGVSLVGSRSQVVEDAYTRIRGQITDIDEAIAATMEENIFYEAVGGPNQKR